jgi:hypothetical protein
MRIFEEGTLGRVVTRVRELVFPHAPRHRPVRYGGREFTAPQLLSEAMLPTAPGLYAIQVRNWWGKVEPLHFGASRNLHEELMVDGHVGFVQWLGHPRSMHGLWVSYLTVAEPDHATHRREGTRLNRHYFPRRTHSADEHLAGHRIHRWQDHRQA